jgi:hypothetical protein
VNDWIIPLDMESIGYYLYMEEQERKQEKNEIEPTCAGCKEDSITISSSNLND